MTLTEKTGHLAWCALVALALARQEQGELSPHRKISSHPLARGSTEATAILARCGTGYRVVTESGAFAGCELSWPTNWAMSGAPAAAS
jgi:hypothetical protein